MAFELPDLPYPTDALAPHISEQTLHYHHGKHHAGYVEKLNGLVEGTEHQDASLEDIIRAAEPGPLFNNAAQVWNHTFYWSSMSPDGGGTPPTGISSALDEAFGGLDAFREAFSEAGTSNFASGWTWLVHNGDGLAIVNTDDAGTPLTGDAKPILTMDVWEHAYYLDRQNERAAYIEAFVENLIDWDFADKNLPT